MTTPNIVKEVINFLDSKGHKCMIYNINKQNLGWCCKDECMRTKFLENKLYNNQESYKFANLLKSQGHECIKYLESDPIQIKWCNQDICIEK